MVSIIAKVNKKLIDIWSLPHIIIGYLFGRYTNLSLPQFTLLNGGFEIFENTVLKKHYDIFNTPFGRETVFESPGNSITDFIITEAGYVVGWEIRLWRAEIEERNRLYSMAKEHARLVGKPFLVVGAPYGNYPCGDYTLDLHPTDECPNEIEADIQDLHLFDDKQFGAVFASHVLEHVEDIEASWNELNRITDKLYVAYPEAKSLHTYQKDHKWFIYSAPPKTSYLEYRRMPRR